MSDQAAAKVDGDWTFEVTNRLESVVGTIRDKTTRPATIAARVVVFGLVAGVLAGLLGVLLVIGVVRVLDVYLPYHPLARRVWTVDAGAAAIFLASGAFLWRKRYAKSR